MIDKDRSGFPEVASPRASGVGTAVAVVLLSWAALGLTIALLG